ncbi:MAG: lipase secretion chaperone [Bacillota bacterium]
MTKTTSIVWAVALGAAAFGGVMATREPEVRPAADAARPNLFPFVRSMEGTRPDGDAQVTSDKTLVVDRELRNLFEYYLAATGEKPLDAIRAEIERELDQRLPPPLAVQARNLLARYLDYKRELAETEKSPALSGNTLDAIRGRLQALQQVRGRYFSPLEVAGMFGLDDAYNNDAVARIEISQDKSLNAEQRRGKLAALDATLPAELREARDAPLQAVRLEQAAATMRAHGASDDEVYRMRAAAVGPEAAARLAAVDREQADWQARIAAYLAERRKLGEGNASGNEAVLQQLRDTYFNPDEQKRLAAYEPRS